MAPNAAGVTHRLPGHFVSSRLPYDARQQRAALDRDPKQVVLLADLQMMMGFPEADMLDLEDSLLVHPQVMGMVVILDDGLYDRLARPRQAHEGLCGSVCFFKDHDAALNQAESWLHSEAAKLYSPS
jgi:hypothetical protein